MKIPRVPHQTRSFVSWPGNVRGNRLNGFSLIEMLITLALLLIMVVMWHGFGSRSNQERQKKACQKNLLTTYVALEIFANEHDGRFPLVPDARSSEDALALLVPHYTVATDKLVCPGSKDDSIPPATPLAGQRISYTYFMGRTLNDKDVVVMSDRLLDTAPKSPGQAVFSSNGKPPGNNHHQYGGNFLLCDGEVRSAGTNISFALTTTPNVTVLNPR